jgi:hypothetical protein
MVTLDDKRDVETFAGCQKEWQQKTEIQCGFAHLEIHFKVYEQWRPILLGGTPERALSKFVDHGFGPHISTKWHPTSISSNSAWARLPQATAVRA